MADVISSPANPLIKRMRLLADRKHRRQAGAFVVQGIQPVWQAVEAGAQIEVLIVAPGLLHGTAAARMVAEQEDRGTRVARLSGALFTRLSDRDGPSGLAAIVHGRTRALPDLDSGPDSLFVALHEVGNPGNLGAIIRTASAVQAGGVLLIGRSTDPFDPVAVKASMGALFSVPVAHAADAEEFLSWAASRRIAVAAASARAEGSFWATRYPSPVAVLLGSEGAGLPPDVLSRADLRVRIPMGGTAESLNLAVAAGILLYEARRHAGKPGEPGRSAERRPDDVL